MASTHITTSRAREASPASVTHSRPLSAQESTAAENSGVVPGGRPGAPLKITPAMKAMITAEHEKGDWFAGSRDSLRDMANAKQCFDAMKRRGLVGADNKPTAAALAVALA